MKLNKSPGPDGLTVEFYRTFWPEVKHLIMSSYKFSFDNGQLGYSHRESIISLIFKKGERYNK